MSNLIISIGRQFGSGGAEIGKKLADKLGIEFYDKELIKRASKESGISEKMFEKSDEKPINSFMYSIVTHGFPAYSTPAYNNVFTNDKIFALQADTIRKIAEEHSAVIIGRCADDILRDHDNLVRVFIYGNIESRTKRISEKYNLSEKEAQEMIRRIDKSRSSYYEFFANKKWGDTNSYDICVDSSDKIDETVEFLKCYIENVRK